jgi:multiple sugar transport system ATP-binding protein
MASITFRGTSKVFPDGTTAVSDLDLEVRDGEFMVFVGPSGCGKTTALRMVAGLERVSEGHITLGERVIDDLPPAERNIAMVFQSYALYPHMSVEQNLDFGLRVRHVERQQARSRVADAARVLGLDRLLDRRPRALSGGQRQRVAMGRAIVREPQAFLMDEPLSNLDAQLRGQVRAEISRLQRRLGVTTIYVTHDQVEAMTMGDRVAVMRHGVLQQVAEPEELYRRPANLFVAGFVGSPAMNFVEADLLDDDGTLVVAFGPHRLSLTSRFIASRPALAAYTGRRVIVGLRPESFEDAGLARDSAAHERLHVLVEHREALGSDVLVHFAAAPTPVPSDDPLDAVDDAQTEAMVVARLHADTRARAGDDLELVVDTEALHFFDAQTRAAITA